MVAAAVARAIAAFEARGGHISCPSAVPAALAVAVVAVPATTTGRSFRCRRRAVGGVGPVREGTACQEKKITCSLGCFHTSERRPLSNTRRHPATIIALTPCAHHHCSLAYHHHRPSPPPRDGHRHLGAGGGLRPAELAAWGRRGQQLLQQQQQQREEDGVADEPAGDPAGAAAAAGACVPHDPAGGGETG